MNKKAYQIKITLKGFKPAIWRRLLILPGLFLSDFHKIIQTSMGWTNSHLHHFIKNQTFYAMRMEDDDMWDEMENIDYKKIKISDLLIKEKDKIVYEYDFGDGWEHDIILEKILPIDDKITYPVCITGKMNCPPEDCGGIWGYSNMLEILKQPDHEEFERYKEWLEHEFDYKHFDKDEINGLLSEDDYGCLVLY